MWWRKNSFCIWRRSSFCISRFILTSYWAANIFGKNLLFLLPSIKWIISLNSMGQRSRSNLQSNKGMLPLGSTAWPSGCSKEFCNFANPTACSQKCYRLNNRAGSSNLGLQRDIWRSNKAKGTFNLPMEVKSGGTAHQLRASEYKPVCLMSMQLQKVISKCTRKKHTPIPI